VHFGLIIPILVLLLAGAGLAIVSSLSGKRKRLEERITASKPRDILLTSPTQRSGSSVRMRSSDATTQDIVYRLLGIPVDLPLAHVISPPVVLISVTILAVAAAWVSQFFLAWWICLLDAVVIWIILVRSIFGWELDRYRGRLLRQMPDTIHLVISATRAGLPVSESFRTVVQEMPNPTSAEFERVVDEMALGVTADDALLNMHRRTGVTEYAIFAVTIGVQARSGGRLAETISNLADTVRDRITIAGRARALSAEARTAAAIMTVLPVITGTLLSIVRPGYLRPLIEDPAGQTMLGVGITTLILGIITMRQLIRSASQD
jgi:tight adherence protein B